MPVTPERLSEVYPRLYHMAEKDSWPSIARDGLLSTSTLLDLYSVDAGDRVAIERQKRPCKVPINHPTRGRAVVRDQAVLHEGKLAKSLRGCTVEEWHLLLNSKVFFWLCKPRLHQLLCAQKYCGDRSTALTVDTLALVTAYRDKITLSAMNTGTTQPMAFPRGPETFLSLNDYPFEERMKRGEYYTVVELAVDGGVPDIKRFVVTVDEMICDCETSIVTSLRRIYP
jgi:hypothetical protein